MRFSSPRSTRHTEGSLRTWGPVSSSTPVLRWQFSPWHFHPSAVVNNFATTKVAQFYREFSPSQSYNPIAVLPFWFCVKQSSFFWVLIDVKQNSITFVPRHKSFRSRASWIRSGRGTSRNVSFLYWPWCFEISKYKYNNNIKNLGLNHKPFYI